MFIPPPPRKPRHQRSTLTRSPMATDQWDAELLGPKMLRPLTPGLSVEAEVTRARHAARLAEIAREIPRATP